MGRFASACAVLIAVALWARPTHAEVLELHRSLQTPPESMPDRPSFEELLFVFADPARPWQGNLSAPSLSLAVRSRAWAFMPLNRSEQRDALDTLSQPAQDMPLSELPAGRYVASLLDLGTDSGQFRVRDLGPRLRGPDGPLLKGVDSALKWFHVPKPVALVSASAAALGLLYQFGTAPATDLGLPTSVSATMLKRRLNVSVQLNAKPRFQEARADMAVRYRLPELPLPVLRLEQIEVGGAAARTPDGLLLDTRWAKLISRVSWLELSVGMHSSNTEPSVWTVFETGVQRDRFSVRTIISRQWETARSRVLATATLRVGPLLSGIFVGDQNGSKHTFGLVGMGWF